MPIEAVTAILIPLMTGYALSGLLIGKKGTIIEKISLSYPLGAGITTMLLFYQGILGSRLNAPFTALAMFAIAIICITASLLINRGKNHSPQVVKPGHKTKLPEKTIIALAATWITARIAATTATAFTMPVWAQDTILNWSARASAFYYDKGLCLKGTDPFAASLGQYTYPPLNPLLQVWTALCLGDFDYTLIKSWVPLFLASATLIIYAQARKQTTALWSVLAAYAFTTAPLLMLHATEPYSDLLVGTYILIATAYLHQATSSPQQARSAALSATATTLAIFTKNDALPFAAFAALAFASWLYLNRMHLKNKTRLAASYILPHLLILPYFIFKAVYHIGFTQSYYEQIRDRITPDLGALVMVIVNTFLAGDSFNPAILIVLAAALYAIAKQRHLMKPIAYAGTALAGYTAFFLFLYVFNVPHQYFLKLGTIFQRNFMTIYPAFTFLAVVSIASAWNTFEEHKPNTT